MSLSNIVRLDHHFPRKTTTQACCLFRLTMCFFPSNYTCADPEGRGGGAGGLDPPPLKNYKIKQYWSRSPEKSQSCQASIQCWAIIGPPAKRHLNGVSLAGRLWPAFSAIWIRFSLVIFLKKNYGPLWQNFLDPRMLYTMKYYYSSKSPPNINS